MVATLRLSLLLAAVLGLGACATSVRIPPPPSARAFDGLPDPAGLAAAPQRLPRATPLVLVVSRNTERLLTLIDRCRDLARRDAARPSAWLLAMTGMTPPEVNARLDISRGYVVEVADALQRRFGSVAFAESMDAARRALPASGGAIALLDASGGRTRCAESPGGDVGLVIDRLDTRVLFLSPQLERACDVTSDAAWRDADFHGLLPPAGDGLARHREYLDWLGRRLERQLGKCVR